MPRRLIETQWRVFSAKFVAYQGLPRGTELRLFDSARRKKRVDFQVKRLPVGSSTIRKLRDSENVRTLLDLALEAVSTDLEARRLKLELFSPIGEGINGNTLLRKVRRMHPKPTPSGFNQKEWHQANEHEIEELKSQAQMSIAESEHLVDDPSHTVCSAYVRALVDRYGRQSVVAALGK